MKRRAFRPLDPMQIAFAAGQEMYKASLLTVVNSRRHQLGKPPLGWPAIATTLHDVEWTEGGARLLHYRPIADAPASKTPVLLICSLINRPYVLDLLEHRSVVRRLLEAGLDVWLLDWGTPRADDAERSLAEYVLGRLVRAADEVRSRCEVGSLHVVGYCMGGTFALMAIAAERLRAQTLVAMATPVDFDEGGLLTRWSRAPGFSPDEIALAHGNVPPYLMQPAFKLLDPVGLATKLVHLEDKLGDESFLRFFFAMESWLEDSVAFPGRAFADWIRLYRENSLVRGKLDLDGVACDLAQVECPILSLVAEQDYIAPAASSRPLLEQVASKEHRQIQQAGGHIGLATSSGAHRTLWPTVAAWLLDHDPLCTRIKKGSGGRRKMVQPHQQRAEGVKR